jgi:hypothetical protein
MLDFVGKESMQAGVGIPFITYHDDVEAILAGASMADSCFTRHCRWPGRRSLHIKGNGPRKVLHVD